MSFSGSGSFSGMSDDGSADEGTSPQVFQAVQSSGQGSNIEVEQLRKEMVHILLMHPQPGLQVNPNTPAPRLLKILKDIIASHEQKVRVLEILYKELQKMVRTHALPQMEVDPGMPPLMLLKALEDIIEICTWKFAAMFPPSKYGEWREDMGNLVKSRKEEIKQKLKEYLTLETDVENVEKDIQYLQNVANMKKRAADDLEKNIKKLDWKLLSLTSKKLELSSIYFDAMSQLESSSNYPLRQPATSTPKTHGFGSGAHRISPLPRRMADTSAKKIEEFMSKLQSIDESDLESPEKFRLGSPYRGVTHIDFDDSNIMSIHTTPRSAVLPYNVTPPSPFDMQNPLIESFGESGAVGGAPMGGTIAIPGPASRFAPRTGTLSSPNLNHVTNRFDIGKSFNLHTVCQTSTPYRQLTRVESSIPNTGHSGEMINSPLSITHSAEITPTQYQTPFISRSRFGYTDPSAQVLNIPPGLVIRVPEQKQGVSPDVVTYGTPPAVTPTTSRRHDIFTPKGIFRRKHYNIRRLYDSEDDESPQLQRSPQYLPQEVRSPVSSLSDSPIYSGRAARLDRTFSTSPKRIYETYEEVSDIYPLVPSHGVINRTFDASSPEILYGAQTTHYSMNRTFDASPQPILNRTFDASPQPILNRTFDSSPQPILNRTFDASPQPILNRTFNASPQPILSRTFDASPQYNLNETFDASSPVAVNRTFEVRSPPAINRTFEASQPSFPSTTFEGSQINALDRTSDDSHYEYIMMNTL